MLKYIAKFEAIIGFCGSALITLASWMYNKYDPVPYYIVLLIVVISFSLIWALLIYVGNLRQKDVSPYIRVIECDMNKILFKTNIKDLLLEGGYVVLYAEVNKLYHMLGIVKIEHIQEKFVQAVVVCKFNIGGIVDKRNIVMRVVLRPEDVIEIEKAEGYNENR